MAPSPPPPRRVRVCRTRRGRKQPTPARHRRGPRRDPHGPRWRLTRCGARRSRLKPRTRRGRVGLARNAPAVAKDYLTPAERFGGQQSDDLDNPGQRSISRPIPRGRLMKIVTRRPSPDTEKGVYVAFYVTVGDRSGVGRPPHTEGPRWSMGGGRVAGDALSVRQQPPVDPGCTLGGREYQRRAESVRGNAGRGARPPTGPARPHRRARKTNVRVGTLARRFGEGAEGFFETFLLGAVLSPVAAA